MRRLFNFFRGRRERLELDLDRELRYHLDRRVDELMKNGLGEPHARRQAQIEFGGISHVQEGVRDAWIWRWLDTLARDVRYATRSLTKSWGFALGASLVLALAIGANTAIFSVVSTVLLQPLAYPNAERIVSVETLWTSTGLASPDVSGPDFLDWKAGSDVFEKLAVSQGGDDFAATVGDRPVFANARYVTSEFFDVFGQAPSAGRLLAEGDVPAAHAEPTVAVVRYHWALAHFGSAEGAIGQKITLYREPLEIVGVAAPDFQYPRSADLWAPWLVADGIANRDDHSYQAVGKLRDGVDITRARAEMRTIGDALARQYPENRVKSATLTLLQDRLTGHLQPTMWALMGAVGVVWLIGCANIANLLLARAAGRTREIALRAALGAGRARVVRQLLTESFVLAGVAGLAGLLVASLLVQGIVALSPANLPRLDEVRLDTTALMFALGLSLVSTMIFGLVPAIQSSRLDLSAALKQGSAKTTVSRGGSRVRSALVVAEVALSVVLLAAAGLLVRSFDALQRVDLGFTTDRIMVAYTDYAVGGRPEIRTRSRHFSEVLDRLRAVPGVSAAAGVSYLPMGREPRAPRDFFILGRPDGQPGERPRAELHAITSDYFKTLEIPIRAGRDFNRNDMPDQAPVAIVNETLARAVFPGASPLGQQIRTNVKSPWMEIVAVVGDTRWQDPTHPAPPVIFVPTTQDWGKSLSILARSSLDQAPLAASLRSFLNEANPTVPVRFETMREMFDVAVAYPRFRTQVIGIFAAVATLLSAVGIFSVLAHLVGHRRRELAVRRALGAGATDVIRLVVGESVRLVTIGLLIGLTGALAVARLLSGLLYGISPWDAGAYLGTVAVLGVAAFVATLIPAVRAATIAPLAALQED